MMKSYLPRSYPTYRSLPIAVKNQWFRAFAQEFNWDPSITETVRSAYDLQADASFRSNLHEWKKTLKKKGPNNAPDWMKSRMSLFGGYLKMWASSQTVEGNGVEPDMLTFIEDVHTCKKTKTIPDNKARQIVNESKARLEEIATQRQTQGEGSQILTQAEINAVVLEQIPNFRGRRFGIGTMVDGKGLSSTKATQNQTQESLEEVIKTMKKSEAEKDAHIKYLMECNKLLLSKFPDLVPPSAPVEDQMGEEEDADAEEAEADAEDAETHDEDADEDKSEEDNAEDDETQE
ncbi:uncharacterized protein LOC112084489 [Eutrema salsugineum]|uniref:uncharacterized protein LOC112084489 n=1 Tax=Eutrema salsugineum TaxID=72664 RepID=UPI000CECF3D6|nr:uncharacterized protein LOC112084489 [Eutrema salsugineum]